MSKTTFNRANKNLIDFDKNEFDHTDFRSCVKRGMLLLTKLKAQLEEDGHEYQFDLDTHQWSIEQAIINREHGTDMMHGVINYVEKITYQCGDFNGIEDWCK